MSRLSEYIRDVIPSTNPMGISPAYVLGLPWLTYLILVVGALAILLRRSFVAAVLTVVLGSPAVGVASIAVLGAAVWDPARSRSG